MQDWNIFKIRVAADNSWFWRQIFQVWTPALPLSSFGLWASHFTSLCFTSYVYKREEKGNTSHRVAYRWREVLHIGPKQVFHKWFPCPLLIPLSTPPTPLTCTDILETRAIAQPGDFQTFFFCSIFIKTNFIPKSNTWSTYKSWHVLFPFSICHFIISHLEQVSFPFSKTTLSNWSLLSEDIPDCKN